MEQQLRSFDGQGNMIRTGRDCVGETGVVSAGRAEAAAIGRDILAQGGNAIDAAVATAFALGVCEPNASGLGGGGFMLLRDGKTGKNVFLDFRETAPQAAAPDMYTPKAPGSNVDIRERNVYGGMSAATPGEVAGLFYALEHYGTMTPPRSSPRRQNWPGRAMWSPPCSTGTWRPTRTISGNMAQGGKFT